MCNKLNQGAVLIRNKETLYEPQKFKIKKIGTRILTCNYFLFEGKMISPTVDELSTKYDKATFLKVDIDEVSV